MRIFIVGALMYVTQFMLTNFPVLEKPEGELIYLFLVAGTILAVVQDIKNL